MREPSARRRDALLGRRSIRGFEDERGGYLYRTGEMLVEAGPGDDVRARISALDLGPDELVTVEVTGEGAGDLIRVRHTLDPRGEKRLHDRARQLGQETNSQRALRASPNHLLTAQPIYMGGGEGAPVPAAAPGDRAQIQLGREVVVGVLDTLEVRHPWLEGSYRRPLRHISVEHHDATLDEAHGHGTFVAGIVIRQAPQALIAVAGVLDDDGVGDDFTVAMGLRELGAGIDILNLALGGYTFDDRPPVALQAELKALPAGTVVVCAAGNNDEDRAFWPAAAALTDDRVISVGALGNDGAKAAFSNYGDWVTVWAPGTDVVSTYPTYHEEVAGDWEAFKGWATWRGTSFAAPFVAGKIAAEMLSGPLPAPQAAAAVLTRATEVTGLGKRIL